MQIVNVGLSPKLVLIFGFVNSISMLNFIHSGLCVHKLQYFSVINFVQKVQKFGHIE